MPKELVRQDELGLERLQRRPIIDRIDARQLVLIKATLAISESPQHPITDAEVGHFLELCAAYGLDPFAREAWIAKSKTGKLLIMIGRAGLRKIVTRNGLKMSSSVVHAKDTFRVSYIDNPADAKPGEWEAWGCAPFHRVKHEHESLGEARGPVIGAWARVRDLGSRQERGYFDAPLSEYMPSNVTVYSPWSKQVSAMTRGAVERQAASEATPLGGLMMEGENESADAAATVGITEGATVDVELPAMVEAVIARAVELGHGEYANRERVAMMVGGQPDAAVTAFCAQAMGELEALAAEQGEEVTDATVVDEPPVAHVPQDGQGKLDADLEAAKRQAENMRGDADALRDEARSIEDEAERTEKLAQADAIDAEADRVDGTQGALL
jgi:hypothetical protein